MPLGLYVRDSVQHQNTLLRSTFPDDGKMYFFYDLWTVAVNAAIWIHFRSIVSPGRKYITFYKVPHFFFIEEIINVSSSSADVYGSDAF